jgi:CSLREA domain-containing protein
MSWIGRNRTAALFTASALAGGLLIIGTAPAMASSLSLTVTSTTDTPDANPGDGICGDATGQCTLRAAIQEADAQPAGTVTNVTVPAGTYALSLGPLPVTGNVIVVTGAGSSATVVKNAKKVRGELFSVAAKASVTLADLELTGGTATKTAGGALVNAGATTLDSVLVTKNTSRSGGGLTNSKGASLTLLNSTVSNNSAASAKADSTPGGSGGGILNAGQLQLTGSTISGNVGGSGGFGGTSPGGRGGDGGGLDNSGTAVITTSTISGNTAGSGGLGLSGNEPSGAGGDGGGIYSSGGSVTLTNSSVTANQAGYPGPAGESPFPRAGNGGGIWSSASLTVSGTSFLSNTTAYPPSSPYAAAGAGGSGGAIYATGMAKVSSSTFTSNAAGAGEAQGPGAGGDGGAIANFGTLTLSGSAVAGNSAGNGGGSANGGAGGGLYSSTGSATLNGDTFSGNTSGTGGNAIPVDPGCTAPGVGGNGGAIYSSSSLTVVNSTVSGNSVGQGGYLVAPCAGQAHGGYGAGMAVQGGSAGVSYSTVANNSDGIYNRGATVTLGGTIVADNSGANCHGPITESPGYNLDSGTTCRFAATTDITNTEPDLGTLADNGGPTQTQALLSGSPAIDHAGTSAGGCPATDQRGAPRPDEAGDLGSCDIGAYESQGVA